MNHPFWLINFTLFIFIVLTSFFMFTFRVQIPERYEDIEPAIYSKPKKEQQVAININHIYENDLFGTYQKEVEPVKQPFVVPTLPTPPVPQHILPPEPPKPKFLEPLNVTLKGIIVTNIDERKNRALIALNKTNQEAVYKVGDTIEDSQLIHIYNNKVVLLRINGQQEVLYLREYDAKEDPTYANLQGWESVVEPTSNTTFNINPTAFMQRVQNIAQFIDTLALTTAYQRGQSVGTRIGISEQNSLAHYLGLQKGDIITSINDIPATTTSHRLEIYNQITQLPLDSTIKVDILRNNATIQYTYTLKNFEIERAAVTIATPTITAAPLTSATPTFATTSDGEDFPAEQLPIEEFEFPQESFENSEDFSLLMKKITDKERNNMLAYSKSTTKNPKL